MAEVGIDALQQDVSAVVARATAGEVIVITDGGRPVARLGPPSSGEAMVPAGRAYPAAKPVRLAQSTCP